MTAPRTVEDVLTEMRAKMRGTTQYEGRQPKDYELLVLEIDRLRGVAENWSKANQAIMEAFDAHYAELEKIRGGLAFSVPMEIDDVRREICGLICFQAAGIASAYRMLGFDIKARAEDEQAFVIHRALRFAAEHGVGWRQAMEAELRRLAASAEEQKAQRCAGSIASEEKAEAAAPATGSDAGDDVAAEQPEERPSSS